MGDNLALTVVVTMLTRVKNTYLLGVLLLSPVYSFLALDSQSNLVLFR